ncbi:MAG: hypothetical protein P8J51_02250 [Dehalococcoidia bacterium]|nr:hypothetical protein [Dehalococcoidia bacterium]
MSTDNALIKSFFSKMHINDFENIFKKIDNLINSQNSDLWLIGGQIRDYYFNYPSDDIDLATDCDINLIYNSLTNNQLFDSNMQYFSKFHTLSIKGKINKFDIAQLRNESFKNNSIVPIINFDKSILNDLRRRDFTINTLAINLNNIHKPELIDPYNGLKDIRNKVLRVLHPNSYINDPTRIFRAARYSARYNLSISNKEIYLINLGIDKIHLLTKQQVDKEIKLINNEKNSMESYALLKEWGYR